MKIKNIWFALLLVFVLTQACDLKLEELNENPNDVTSIDDEYLFANATFGTMRGGGTLKMPFATQYAHMYTGRNNSIYKDRYFDYFENDEYAYVFDEFFQGPVRLIIETIRLTAPDSETSNEVRHAMAQVIAMVNYARLSDAFGAIPYLQGGLGQTGILYPEYDSVEFIYMDMMERLKNIVLLLETADPENGYPGADPLFDNDLEQWAKFANSFRLRLAMRARFAAPTEAEAIIVECLEKPLIESNEDNAWNENQDSDVGEFSNPIYGQFTYWLWKMSEFLVENLKSTNDPRLELFVKPNKNGEYIGLPNGLSDAALTQWNVEEVSDPTDLLVGKAAPIFLLTASEVWQLRAEAALFGIGPEAGNENNLYRIGIQKSLEQWGAEEADIAAYMASEYATLTGTQEEMFEQICMHQWIGFMSNAPEAWANIRRTGYPVLPVRTEPEFSLGVTNGVLPTRLKYPSGESNLNEENYLKILSEQGPDEITTPLWWDIRN
jgi:hypothetical protein